MVGLLFISAIIYLTRWSVYYHSHHLQTQYTLKHIEVELHYLKLLIGVYYCPSLRINFLVPPESPTILPIISSQVIIMGNFNTYLLKNAARSSVLLSIFEFNYISLLRLKATHNFPNCTLSLLVLVLVLSGNRIAKREQSAADGFSKHDLLSHKIRPRKVKSRVLMQRKFSGISLNLLKKDAEKIVFVPLVSVSFSDERIEIFINC